MKKLACILLVAIAFVSCNKEVKKDYVTLSGKITNPTSDSLVVAQNAIIKSIKVNPDGTFSDTLKVASGNYVLFDGQEQANVYLENGYDLRLTMDTNKFDETIKFEGIGEDVNNYLAEKVLLQERLLDYDELMASSKTEFENKLNSSIEEFKSLLTAVPNVDATFVKNENISFGMLKEQLKLEYSKNSKPSLFNGKAAPKFNDYENYAGGSTSLDDLKGKYVYIDLWATWCGPCKAEIPALKRVEKAYHGKNIAFVSISLDSPNAYDKWKAMVKEKELTGVQLYAKGDQKFARDFKVSTIPRFILIDPNGIVVNDNAPRPSSKQLTKIFDRLEI
ncbi:AhpC/TSA family protein [Algibacter amylolyticus]|uniref:AhpC/TSA family protein n=1 Tax=Algibacter amylolyticus TaxID=1608400 RepID=A0A5M7B861_9FLAO|nr:TlpA disulfide reductase family protein [Algibacter amylolyticus]KAA5825736.1 AhpC/TSA family protein [Algibacter amylolyticus]MBB5268030.1 thiol-disulfide isomerase/thioredoxin [Algibacter amylolyticus]TSJ80034.1 AhpC/TSA family protein [Algibacter amylolyticus]